MIKLVLERDGKAPEVWVCSDDSFLVGRGVEPPHWRLPYPDVSRKHLRFSVREGQAFIEGLSERSPAYVNKRRLRGLTPLSQGDTIVFGNCRMRVAGTPQAKKKPTPTPSPARSSLETGLSGAIGQSALDQASAAAQLAAATPPPGLDRAAAQQGGHRALTEFADMSDIVRKAVDWRNLDKPIAELMDRQLLRRGLAWKKRGTPDLGEDGALVRLYVDTSREHRRLGWIRRGLAAASVVFACLGGFTVAKFLSGEVKLPDSSEVGGQTQCTPERYKGAQRLLQIAKQASASDSLLLAGLAYVQAEDSHCERDYSIEESLREIMSGHRGSVLGRHTAAIASAAIAPNRRYIASLDDEGHLELWDRGGREVLAPKDTGDLVAVAWSADSEMLATGDRDGGMKLWSIVDSDDRNQALGLSLTKTLAGHRQEITALTFSSGGEYLASADRSGKVRLWDMGGEATGDALGTSMMRSGPSPLLIFDGSAKRLFGHSGGGLQIWQLDRGAKNPLSDKRRWRLPTEHDITTVGVHRDGDRLLTGDAEGIVILWSIKSKNRGKNKSKNKGTKFIPRKLNLGESNAISHVAFVPTKDRALYTTTRGDLTRVNTAKRGRRATDTPSYRLSSEVGEVDMLLIDPSGRRALTVSATSGRQLWDLGSENSEYLRKLDEGGPRWNEAFVVPNAAEIISGDADGRIMSWDLLAERSDAGAWSLTEQRGAIDAIAQPPAREGTPTFFTASRDSTIREWEYRTGQPLTVRTIATEADVKHLAVSRHHIVGAAQDRLWIWDRGPEEEPKPLVELSAGRAIHHLGLSRATGDWLVTIDETGRMRSWHITQHLNRQPDQEMKIEGTVRSLVVLKERAFVATHNGNASEIMSWDLGASKAIQRTIATGGRYSRLVTSQDGEIIAYGEDNGAVHLLQGEESKGKSSVAGAVTALALSFDNSQLAFGSSRGEIGLLAKNNATPLTLSDGAADEISELAFAQDNTLLVAAGEHLYKYQLPSTDGPADPHDPHVLDLYGHSGVITALRVDAGQDYAVSAGLDEALMVWPLRGDRLIHRLCSKAEIKLLSPGARRKAGLANESPELCR